MRNLNIFLGLITLASLLVFARSSGTLPSPEHAAMEHLRTLSQMRQLTNHISGVSRVLEAKSQNAAALVQLRTGLERDVVSYEALAAKPLDSNWIAFRQSVRSQLEWYSSHALGSDREHESGLRNALVEARERHLGSLMALVYGLMNEAHPNPGIYMLREHQESVHRMTHFFSGLALGLSFAFLLLLRFPQTRPSGVALLRLLAALRPVRRRKPAVTVEVPADVVIVQNQEQATKAEVVPTADSAILSAADPKKTLAGLRKE